MLLLECVKLLGLEEIVRPGFCELVSLSPVAVLYVCKFGACIMVWASVASIVDSLVGNVGVGCVG